ncbi:hypothetical protein COO91_08783 [Nostoc flagelliforme CCNUN1]|uniref:Uncharacterized protein n=1 Tax=Nostoc flagelliforme CCNUN1 TaxID=2038116 RepID=A0A2K8T4K9_9NOSO|nr:hypothetical protein COO91_08783 [Nostoc flagelliforme CCNUN1]
MLRISSLSNKQNLSIRDNSRDTSLLPTPGNPARRIRKGLFSELKYIS